MDESLRRSIMLDLICRLQDQGSRVTMTSLQKLPYFLQEVMGVPLGVRFVMHYYGPYSFDLARSIDGMAAARTISISPHPTGYGYEVSAGQRAEVEAILAATETERNEYDDHLTQLISHFGRLSVDELELLSTSHFVRNLLRRRALPDDNDRIAAEVVSLKPKFGRQRIEGIVSQLDEIVRQLNAADR